MADQEAMVKYSFSIFSEKLESKVPARFFGRNPLVRDIFNRSDSGELDYPLRSKMVVMAEGI